MTKKFTVRQGRSKEELIREFAQRAADVEFGDFGTLGGSQAPHITEYVLSLKGADRLLFTELYLSELRIRLLSPDFETNTRYEKREAQFNPRS
jgi:hypothetical protein